jgi:hypothetical protein
MSYLCIDVEWNIPADQAEDIELLSIGVACWDSVNRLTRTYFRIIRPNRIDLVTPTTYRLLNLGPVVLNAAKSSEEVLSNFANTFQGRGYLSKDDPIVVWNREAWDLLKSHLDKFGLSLPMKKVVILQDVLSFADKDNHIGRSMGFETALRRYGVNYRRELLHNSKYDAQYLIDLYDAVYDRLTETGDAAAPLVHTKFSKILHQEGCRYLKGREVYDGDWADALFGWQLCSYCGSRGALKAIRVPKKKQSAKQPIIRLPQISTPKKTEAKPPKPKKEKPKPLDELAFTEHCENLGISCHFSIGWVFLRTPVSFWKIKYEDTKVLTVLHQSMHVSRSDAGKRKRKTNEGFHQQYVFGKDIFQTVNYIYEHDKHFLYPKYSPSYWGERRAN